MDKKIVIGKAAGECVPAHTLNTISFGTASGKEHITVAELGSKIHAALGAAGNLVKGCAEIVESADIADATTKEDLSAAILQLCRCEHAFVPFRIALSRPLPAVTKHEGSIV